LPVRSLLLNLEKSRDSHRSSLAKKIGVSYKTVFCWKTEKYLPFADALKIMSEIFDVSINEILSGKRLTVKEYKDAAEENLTQAIKASSFSLKDRIEFYRRKWLKDHAAIMVFIGICIVGVLIAGIVLRKYLLGYSAIVMLIIGHVWRYNTMMVCLENYIYNDSYKQ
jgi:DNA-binding XRE family transcriptional regulator